MWQLILFANGRACGSIVLAAAFVFVAVAVGLVIVVSWRDRK
jgi:hypothetical protein